MMLEFSRIYRNNHKDTFTDIEANLCPVSYGAATWGDYDNDGDPDIVLCGNNHMEVYENLGDDQFQNINAGMVPLYYGAAAWGDYDNDGFLDIVCQGLNTSGHYTKLYRNNGIRGFVEVPTRLQNCWGGSLAWGDYNCDGRLDLLLTGSFNGFRTTRIYRNENWGIFADIGEQFPDLSSSWGTWTDFDNDGKLDMFLAGYDGVASHSKLYRNNYPFINTNPSPPVLSLNQASGLFQFSGADDSTTPQAGLSYDIRIGTSPGACDVCSPLAHQDGRRKVEEHGSKAIRFIPQPNQIYYAAAQAIDHGFARSAFSDEIMFNVGGDALISCVGNSFLDFGSVYVEHQTQLELVLTNSGTGALVIDNVALVSGLNFHLEPVQFPQQILTGATWCLYVSFHPLSNGIMADTLVVTSNAVNSPVLRIPVMGRGVSAPPSPVENLSISQLGPDALISWAPVTTTTEGDPITPSLYLVMFNQLPNDPDHFWFLAATASTSYIHASVYQFSPTMFYQVIAVVIYDDELRERLSLMGMSPFLNDMESIRALIGPL